MGGPGLQDNRFHTSTRGFCEGLLNARSGRPQKEVTTADSGIGDIPLDPSRCWPWTTCSLKTAGLQVVPPVLKLPAQNLYPQCVPRPSTLHAVKSPTFGHALPLNHTLYSQPLDHSLCSAPPSKLCTCYSANPAASPNKHFPPHLGLLLPPRCPLVLSVSFSPLLPS